MSYFLAAFFIVCVPLAMYVLIVDVMEFVNYFRAKSLARRQARLMGWRRSWR